MRLLRSTLLLVIFAAAVFLGAAPLPVDQGSNTREMDIDHSIKPGDDFYHYANGGWLKAAVIPTGQTSYDTRAMLVEKTSQRVRDIIQKRPPPRPSGAAWHRRLATTTPASWTQMASRPRG